MLRNSDEKMVIISSSNNQWPQKKIDEKTLMIGSTMMEKPISADHNHHLQQQQQQQNQLKCPRCDSSNTKFCYYNNYSLSQPRHFCKACKRYWTRGGTLRNVPVGGGCRKNKRVKRPNIPSSSTTAAAAAAAATTSTTHNNNVMSNDSNPLLYGLLSTGNNPSSISDHLSNNIPFGRFNDVHPQFSSVGLGFSSGSMILPSTNLDNNYQIFGSNSSSSSVVPPNMSRFIGQSKLVNGGNNHFQTLSDLQEGGSNEDSKNNMGWNYSNNVGYNCQNGQQISNILSSSSSSDPVYINSLYNWNTTSNVGAGSWFDPPNNIGSSVTSLI